MREMLSSYYSLKKENNLKVSKKCFNVYGVYHMRAVPVEARRGRQNALELKCWIVMSGLEPNWVLYKSNDQSYSLSLLSSRLKLKF